MGRGATPTVGTMVLVAIVAVVSPLVGPAGGGSGSADASYDEAGPDRRAPRTSIVAAPRRRIETIRKRVRVRFRFRADEGRLRFKCRVDGRRWHYCRSPVRVSVGPGRHRFAVRARDRRGNVDRSPAGRRWKVKRWQPNVKAARRYARSRGGPVSFAVDLGWREFGFRRGSRAVMASTVKVMLMAAYLRQQRRLDAGEKGLLGRMIRYSDNGAATTVRNIVGTRAIKRLARRAGMSDFRYSSIWGICETSGRDQASFMRNLDRYLPRRHRRFGRRLLGNISGAQSWGIGTIGHRGWSLRFKGGWGISDHGHGGTVNHQIAALQRGRWKVGIAILTQGNHSAGYGQQTLRTVSRLLLRGLPH